MSSQSQKSQALLSLWGHLVLTSIAKQTHTHSLTHRHRHTPTHTHTHRHRHRHTHTHTHTHSHRHTHTHTRKQTQTDTHTLTHSLTHAHAHTHAHTHTRANRHRQTRTHSLTHSLTHTRTHTHTHTHTHECQHHNTSSAVFFSGGLLQTQTLMDHGTLSVTSDLSPVTSAADQPRISQHVPRMFVFYTKYLFVYCAIILSLCLHVCIFHKLFATKSVFFLLLFF